MEKNQAEAAKQRAADIDTLRSLHNNNVELRHRVDGKKMSFPANDYPDGLENSGYNPADWVLAKDFENPEGPDHATEADANKHPAFEGTGQSIGTHLGTTPAERAAVGDTTAERTLGHIAPDARDANGELAAETIKKQQSQTPDTSPHAQAPNASDRVADAAGRNVDTSTAKEVGNDAAKIAAGAKPGVQTPAPAKDGVVK